MRQNSIQLVRWELGFRMMRGLLRGSLVFCLMLAGCRRSPTLYPVVEGPLSAGEELRIGMVSSSRPLYGRRSVNSGINAAYLLRDRVNQCGGVNGAPISFVVERADDLPRSELAAAKELLDDYRVHGAIANLSSREPSQSLNEFAVSQVPVLTFAYPSSVADILSSAKLFQPPQNYLGQLSPSYQESIQALAQVVWSQGYTQVAFIRVDDPSSQGWVDTFTQAFEALGGQRVDRETPIFVPRYDRYRNNIFEVESDSSDDTDGDRPDDETFRFEPAQAAQLSTWLDQEQTALIVELNRFRSLDFLQALTPILAGRESLSLFWADWLEFEAVWERILPDLDESAESSDRPRLVGVAGLVPAIVGDGFSVFKEAWVKHFNEEPPSEAAYTWDAVALFALAAQAAGNNGGPSIATNMQAIATPPGVTVTDVCEGLERLRAGEEINYEGASGSLDLSAQGTLEHRFDLWRVTSEGMPTLIDRVNLESDSAVTP